MVRYVDPADRHRRMKDAVVAAMSKEVGDMPSDEMLAVLCQIVGQMIALQDQRKYTAASVMDLVSRNIEIGNQMILEAALNEPAKGRA